MPCYAAIHFTLFGSNISVLMSDAMYAYSVFQPTPMHITIVLNTIWQNI